MAEKYFGESVKKLGFGLMRLPKKGLVIDVDQTSKMVDMFLENGFTYFDTAYIYPGSEAAIKKALIERHDRSEFTLADKLHVMAAPSEKLAKKEFETSLKRTGAQYFDYYLVHSITEGNYPTYMKKNIFGVVEEYKKQGLIKHLGFSFHGGPALLEQVLTEHPDMEFVQLQINYADWNNDTIQSRKNYEVARKFGKSIVVMEPVKGGKLANPPAEVKKLFKEINPDASFASWAIRFVASLDGIITVLSGMSNIEQMENNISYMKSFKPLDKQELETIKKAQEYFAKDISIPCTGCGYCEKGCPKNIPIPKIFAAKNAQLTSGKIEEAKKMYEEAIKDKGRASMCIECHQCENACPQHIAIIDNLKNIKITLE